MVKQKYLDRIMKTIHEKGTENESNVPLTAFYIFTHTKLPKNLNLSDALEILKLRGYIELQYLPGENRPIVYLTSKGKLYFQDQADAVSTNRKSLTHDVAMLFISAIIACGLDNWAVIWRLIADLTKKLPEMIEPFIRIS